MQVKQLILSLDLIYRYRKLFFIALRSNPFFENKYSFMVTDQFLNKMYLSIKKYQSLNSKNIHYLLLEFSLNENEFKIMKAIYIETVKTFFSGISHLEISEAWNNYLDEEYSLLNIAQKKFQLSDFQFVEIENILNLKVSEIVERKFQDVLNDQKSNSIKQILKVALEAETQKIINDIYSTDIV